MRVLDYVDVNLLQGIQDCFATATNLAAVAVDTDGEYITRPSNFTRVCEELIRKSPEGKKRCQDCDANCNDMYFCHAGLIDFSTDIMVRGEIVAKMKCGQILTQPMSEKSIKNTAKELGINEKDFREALKEVPVRSEQSIRASADLLREVFTQTVNFTYNERILEDTLQIERNASYIDMRYHSNADSQEDAKYIEQIFDYDLMTDVLTAPASAYSIVGEEYYIHHFSRNMDEEVEKYSKNTKFRESFESLLKEAGRRTMDFRTDQFTGEMRWYRLTMVSFQNHLDEVCRIIGKIVDIQPEKLQEMDDYYHSDKDSLTGLYNKEYFENNADLILNSGEGEERISGLLVVDIDDFGEINLRMGRDAGDEAIVEFASSLKKSFRGTDYLARIGGDSFCIIMKNIKHEENAFQIIERARKAVARSYVSGEQVVSLTGSFGVAFFDRQGTTYEELLQNARIAMAMAKERGKDCFLAYEDGWT